MKPITIKQPMIMGVVLAALLSACSHGPTVQEFPDTASPQDEVSRLAEDMSVASNEQVNILSPVNFKKATGALEDAKTSLDKQRSPKSTLEDVAKGRAYLNRANQFAKVAHENIEQVIVARSQAIATKAPDYFQKDFSNADDEMKDMTSGIENNKLSEAVANRSALQLKYLDLELRAIKYSRLNQPKETIAKAIKEGAKEFAPRTLAIAEKSVFDTDAFITANRHDTSAIDERTQATRASTDHLLKITRASKSGDKATSEDAALRLETAQMSAADKQGTIEDQKGQIDRGAQANKELMTEQELNRQFESARKQFTEEEAMVYKQGNTLMIRMKGLAFPTAQAVIKGSNFPLLAKVQKVIKDFGPGVVIVEGHTDAIGGKAANELLSAKRAEAVKAYLVSNASSENLEIKSVGYGYQKPLSTNKTEAGRAQNRRVDILIKPASSSQAM